MSTATRKVREMLKAHGATLIRQAKHKIWRLPNGKNYVESSTPSDVRADRNGLTELRKRLDMPNAGGQPRERREKTRTQARVEPVKYEKFNSALAEQLRLKGVRESVLQDEIEMQKYHIEVLTERLVQAEEAASRCWMCRWRKKLGW